MIPTTRVETHLLNFNRTKVKLREWGHPVFFYCNGFNPTGQGGSDYARNYASVLKS